MGSTKVVSGDGHLLFHVGKELPSENSNFILVPGNQDAQGRGVYFSDEPRLKYSGGEEAQKKLDITPVYAIPMYGEWCKAKNKKKNEITYHTNEQLIFMYGLQRQDAEVQGKKVRFYLPKQAKLIKEKDVFYNGRHTWCPFSEQILDGRMSFEEALHELQQYDECRKTDITPEQIHTSYQEALKEKRIPRFEALREFAEYRRGIRKK